MSGSSIAAEAALAATTGAAFVIPAAWPLVAEMFEDQNDPEAILAAGLKWLDMAEKLGQADSTAKGVVQAVPESEWKGKDRKAFESSMDDYSWQITFEQYFGYVVGAATICLAVMLFVLIAVMVVIAAIMVFEAAVVVLAMVGVITGVGAQAAADAMALNCFNVLDKVDTVEEKVAMGLAAGITAMMGVEVVGEMVKGNSDTLGDLGGALVDGADNIVWGTLSRLERDLNKGLMNGAKWPLSNRGFTLPTIPKIAAPWGNVTNGTSVAGWGAGNITDNIHAHVPDVNG
jgi:hypothetical protein